MTAAGPRPWVARSVPDPSPEVDAAELDDEVALWHRGQLHRLDPLASRLWQRFDGRSTIREIALECAHAFGRDRTEVERDLLDLCATLDQHGLFVGSHADIAYQAAADPEPHPVVGPGPVPARRDLHGETWPFESGSYVAISHRFRIRSTDRTIGRYLEEALGGLRAHSEHAQWYSVLGTGGGDGFEVFLGDAPLSTVPDPPAAVRHVLWHINTEAVRRCTDRVIVHASAAASGGRAVVMPGTINAGKSTLVAGLARAGFEYLTDELTVIDPVTLLVHPYPRPLNLGAGAWALLPELRPTSSQPALARRFRTWHVDPTTIATSCIAAPVRPAFVIAPRYAKAGGTALEPLPRSEALKLLIDQTMNTRLVARDAFLTLAAVVRSSTCLRLRLDSLHMGVDLLRSVVEHGSPPPRSTRDTHGG